MLSLANLIFLCLFFNLYICVFHVLLQSHLSLVSILCPPDLSFWPVFVLSRDCHDSYFTHVYALFPVSSMLYLLYALSPLCLVSSMSCLPPISCIPYVFSLLSFFSSMSCLCLVLLLQSEHSKHDDWCIETVINCINLEFLYWFCTAFFFWF